MMSSPPPIPETYELLHLQTTIPPPLPVESTSVASTQEVALSLVDVGVMIPRTSATFARKRPRIGISSVTCEITVGSLCVVTGANGAGKSTLLRGIATLLPLSQGTISYFGQSPRSATQARQLFSYCGDRLGVYEDMNVGDFLSFFAQAYGVSNERGRELLSLLQHRLHLESATLVEELSLGQRQRLSLARALLFEAPLLIVDEPTNALDIDMASVVRQLLVELTGLGLTVIAATHDDHLIARATQQIHLADGRFQNSRLLDRSPGNSGGLHVE